MCLSVNHRKRDLCQTRQTWNLDPTGLIEEPRTPIDFDKQIVDRRKQVQWKRELAGKWMAPVTGDANSLIRRAIQHFKIGRAAEKTDQARTYSPKRVATKNEKLAPLHTKRIGRKAKIDIEVVAWWWAGWWSQRAGARMSVGEQSSSTGMSRVRALVQSRKRGSVRPWSGRARN